MNKLLIICLINILCISLVKSQVTYLETKIDGQGGIEGIQYPKNMVTDSTGKELIIVADNCLTHLKKNDLTSSYEFVETIKYSSDVYNGLWNVNQIISNKNDKIFYVPGDRQLNTFALDANTQKLKYLESINNSEVLTIGGAYSSTISVSPDNRNLYMGTSYGSKTFLHIFKIDPTTGILYHKNSITSIWKTWEDIFSIASSPSNEFLYTTSFENQTGSRLSVFKKNIEKDSLELVQVLTKSDSVYYASAMAISPDNKNLYIWDGKSVFAFTINSNTGNLSYLNKFYIPSYFDSFRYFNCLQFTKDGRFLYIGGEYDLSVFERNLSTGDLSFVQVVKEGDPNYAGFNDVKAVYLSNHDSLLYAISKSNNSIHVFNRDISSGKITLKKKMADQQGKIVGLNAASDLLTTNDNKTVVTLASWNDYSMSIFDRLENGKLSFRRSVSFNELGSAVGAPWSFKITPDDKYLYISSTNMYGIRLMKRDPVTTDFTYSKSYTYSETGMTPEERIVEAIISPNLKNYYAATYSNIVTYSRNQDNGELTFQSRHKIDENSTNGLRGITSIAASSDNKYIFTCSNVYVNGISVYLRNQSDGNLSFLQSVKNINAYKVLVSKDNKYIYALGDCIYTYSVDATTGNLVLLDKLNIQDLGYSLVSYISDGIINNDQKAIIGITKQGKAILSFYRNQQTGKVSFNEIRYYSTDNNYSSDDPKIKMSADSKNVYVVSPYDKSLICYNANLTVEYTRLVEACKGDTAVLKMEEGYEYLWSNGKTTNQIKITVPGSYTVNVKDKSGREGWYKSNAIFHPVPTVKIALDTTNLLLNTKVNGGEWPYNYLWDDGSSGYSKKIVSSDLYGNKKFYVLVTDKHSCKSRDTIVLDLINAIEITQKNDNFKFSVTPNPVCNQMNIHFTKSLDKKSILEIFDPYGNKLFHSILERDIISYQVDLNKFSPGIYIIKLLSDDKVTVNKIVKQ